MLHPMKHRVRLISAARAAVVMLFVGLWSAACAQGSVPVAPSGAGSTGGATTARKVGDPAAPPCDSANPCKEITGNVTFTGPSLTFSAGTRGRADQSDPNWYSASTVFAVQPQGRLEDSSIAVTLAVSEELAHITVFRKVGEASEERIAGTAIPQLTTVADASCASGRLNTQFVVNLEKFGKTTIGHSHCK